MTIPWTEILDFLGILGVCALVLGAGYIVLRLIGAIMGFGSDGDDDDKPKSTLYIDENGNFWDHPPYERRAKEVSDHDHHNETERSRALHYGDDSYIDFDGYKRNPKTGEYMYMNKTNTPNPRRK